MLRFLARRLPSVAFMLIVTSIIAFLLPRLAGGDPAQVVAGADATAEQVEAIRVRMGLDQPMPVQYLDWLGGVLRGDIGISLISNRPISQLILSRLGSTLELALSATLLMVLFGLSLGILAGSVTRGPGRTALDVVLSVLLATPPHVTGLVLILLLGIVWQILPISGEVSILRDPLRALTYLTLPAFALALPQAATIARLIQARMRQVRQEEFVDLARAKGVPARRIAISHVLRNSLGTAVVAVGIRVGELLAGAVVIESIFGRNGLGLMAVEAVSSRDYQVVQVLVLGAVVIAVLVHLLSEILLAALDLRIRLEFLMTGNPTIALRSGSRRSLGGEGLRRYLAALTAPKGVVGGGLLLVLALAALFAPLIFPGGVDQQSRNSFLPPSFTHPFGTDELGRDIFVRCIYALRISISLVIVAVPAAMVLGTMMGLSGALSLRLGNAFQRLFDIILGFPSLVLGICIVIIIGPGWVAIAATIVIFSLPQFGRLARGQLLSEINREYVLAARVLGVSKGRIMVRHILPNTLDAIFVQMSLSMIGGIFLEAALSIVGLGIQPPTPSLGTLLNVGIRYVYAQPMYTGGPVIMLLLLALAFNLIADALNAAVLKTRAGS